MNRPTAFLNGTFCPAAELVLPVDDLGVLQGVTVAERVRTFNGILFKLSDHLTRLANSLEIIGVTLEYSLEHLGQIATELVERNNSLLSDGDDLGLSIFVTPGTQTEGQPTLGIHCYPLPFEQWSSYYTAGQALTETGIRQIPSSCWPLELKCRSRMHYYLADQRAHQIDSGSRAVLLDQEGHVTEASTANIVYHCANDGLVSPPLHRILPGVSLAVLEQLAAQQQIPMHHRDFQLEDLMSAEEILLCSTSPCVWPVTRLNKLSIGKGVDGPIFHRLLAAWSELVGLDISDQALRIAARRQ